jgi:hypothetical protein
MKKSFNSTLVLFVVLAGLLSWYLIYEKKIKPAREEKQEQSKVLVTTARDDIHELVLEQRQGDPKAGKYRTLTFKKIGGDWNLVAPIEDLADSGAINGLITAFAGTKQDRVVDEKPADLEPYGLKTPVLKISVKKAGDGQAETILVGNDTPVGTNVYVKVAGKDPVYRAPQTLRSSFDKDVAEYRNKKILPFGRAEVAELEIRAKGDSFVLKKDEQERWLLAREGLPAADNEVNKTLNSLVEANATAFAAEKAATGLAQFGLAPAAVTVTFKKKDGQSLLLLGKAKDKFYAKRGDKDVVFEVPKDIFERAARPAKDYRDLKIAHFNRFDTKRIKIEHGTEAYELVKENTQWKIASDPNAKIDTAKVEDYLSRLQDSKLGTYLKPAQKPKGTDLIIHVFEKKGSAEEAESVTLRFTKTGTTAVGERKGLDAPFTVDEAEFKKINAFKQEFLASEKKPENKAESEKS